MEITITELPNTPLLVEKAAAVTANREPRQHLLLTTWHELLAAEHSPIRCYQVYIELNGIPSYASVHLTRHKVGVEHFVKSQRPNTHRAEELQGALVNHSLLANAQALITMSHRRLCHKADDVTRDIMAGIVNELCLGESQYARELSRHLMPMCEYRCGCYEPRPCGHWRTINATE